LNEVSSRIKFRDVHVVHIPIAIYYLKLFLVRFLLVHHLYR
jgi:hypothetical protein